jgi:hypothetical protein
VARRPLPFDILKRATRCRAKKKKHRYKIYSNLLSAIPSFVDISPFRNIYPAGPRVSILLFDGARRRAHVRYSRDRFGSATACRVMKLFGRCAAF